MSTPIRYGVLFEVEIRHDYFLSLGSRVHEALDDAPRSAARRGYSVPGFLRVFPTAPTEQVLAGHRAVFKTTAGGFLVGIQLDPAAAGNRPSVPPGAGFRLRFALAARDPRFFNYTALVESADGFYHLGNGSGNETAGLRFLSRPVPDFSASRAYRAGEVRARVSGATIDLFRAERDTGPSAAPVAADWRRIPPDTFDPAASYTAGAVVLSANRLFRALVNGPRPNLDNPALWQPIGTLANQYVTAADSRALRPERFDLDLGTAALPRATLRLLRPGTTEIVWERLYEVPAGSLGTVPVDLRGVEPGPYRLAVLYGSLAEVPGLGGELYLDPAAVRGGWLGVIEIGPGAGGLALLDGGGALRSPRYTLRFLNRATRWRYIFPAAQALGAGAEVATEGGDPRILVTADTRPLTRFGTGVRLRADLPATSRSEEVLLPEPETRSIRRQNQQWFSEIQTNNLPL